MVMLGTSEVKEMTFALGTGDQPRPCLGCDEQIGGSGPWVMLLVWSGSGEHQELLDMDIPRLLGYFCPQCARSFVTTEEDGEAGPFLQVDVASARKSLREAASRFREIADQLESAEVADDRLG